MRIRSHRGALNLLNRRVLTGARKTQRLDPADPLNRGVAARWSFAPAGIFGASDRLRDLSGNGWHGTLAGGSTYFPQLSGGALHSGNFATTNFTTSFILPTTNFSVSFWAQSGSSGLGNRPLGNSDASLGTSGWGVIWGYSVASHMYVVARTANNGTKDIELTPPTSIADTNTLHSVICTLDATEGMRVYWDGVLAGSNAVATSIVSSLGFNLAKDNNGSSQFTGLLGDVIVWSRVIGAGEIQRVANDRTGNLALRRSDTIIFPTSSVSALTSAVRRIRLLRDQEEQTRLAVQAAEQTALDDWLARRRRLFTTADPVGPAIITNIQTNVWGAGPTPVAAATNLSTGAWVVEAASGAVTHIGTTVWYSEVSTAEAQVTLAGASAWLTGEPTFSTLTRIAPTVWLSEPHSSTQATLTHLLASVWATVPSGDRAARLSAVAASVWFEEPDVNASAVLSKLSISVWVPVSPEESSVVADPQGEFYRYNRGDDEDEASAASTRYLLQQLPIDDLGDDVIPAVSPLHPFVMIMA